MTDLKPCPTCGRAEPTVKPLVWEGFRSGLWRAATPICEYEIECDWSGDELHHDYYLYIHHGGDADVIGSFGSLEDAKSAAFNHHEPRVWECLV